MGRAGKGLGNSHKTQKGTSLVVQWLGPGAFTAEGSGSIPGRGTKIPQATQGGQNK